MNRPLDGLVVLEFCQFLAGPSAGLKLADMGARVIKIERPVKGEAGRQLAIKNMFVEGNSLLFHTINRNKESYAADLKNPDDLEAVKKLIEKADVITHNFRPGVMEKIGLDYHAAKLINPRIIYATVTGYGNVGPWANKPGQDLLVQSLSGLTYLSGTADQGPVPFGLSVSDIMCGNHLTQGILAALIKRSRTNTSVLVEVSLMESTLDLQFEVITTYLNDGRKLPQRSEVRGSGHAYLSAPYGLYETADGHLALAMGDLTSIGIAIGCDTSTFYTDSLSSFEKRDDIIKLLSSTFKQRTTREWLDILIPRDIWCAEVLTYKGATDLPAFIELDIRQSVQINDTVQIETTRSPIRIDHQKLFSSKPAPKVGEHNSVLNEEFNIEL